MVSDKRILIAAVLLLSAAPPDFVAAQCPDGSPPPCAERRAAPAPNTVAVLYFDNLSRDTSDAYLADGLTEDVTAELGEVSRLAVTSHAAMRHFRETSIPLATLGRTLNVTYLVSGGVQRSGSRLRVTVELVRAASGARVWGQQYNRETADFLTIQEEIAAAVATGITGQLFPAERASLAARPTRNAAAYDHYLRGNKWLWRRDEHSVQAALAEYEAALRVDSTFAAARGRLAFTYGVILNYSYALGGLDQDIALARGLAEAARAIREDSTIADAWLGRAFMLALTGRPGDLAAALLSFQRAVALDPTNGDAHAQYAAWLRRTGRFEESEREYQRARAINPWAPTVVSDVGFLDYSRRRYESARALQDSAIAIDSLFSTIYGLRARARAQLGDSAGALADALTALRLSVPSEQLRSRAELAEMEMLNGQREQAARRLDAAFAAAGWPGGKPGSPISVRNAYDPALAAIALGRRDVALAILERARPRGPWLWSYLIWPGFDSLRSDPRFIKVYDDSKPPDAPEIPR